MLPSPIVVSAPARSPGAITWASFAELAAAGGLSSWALPAKACVRRPWVLAGAWADLEVWAPVTSNRPPGPCAYQAGAVALGASGDARGYRGGWVSCRALGIAEAGALPLVGDLRLPILPRALEEAARSLAERARRDGPADALAPLTAACEAASPSRRPRRRM